MNIPQKTAPLLFILLLVAAFLLGRYQGQVEILKGGQVTGKTLPAQTGDQGTVSGGDQVNNPGEPTTVLNDDQWKELISGAAASKGAEGAPVTMVEFTDYQCPYCNRHFTDTYPQIEKEYIATGKVRYMIRDFPLPFHANAGIAAQAARCAGDQGKYWEMHDTLFEKQDEWSSGDAKKLFTSYAGDAGLNSSSFSECLASEKHKQAVDTDLALAQKLGVGGTPGFFINKQILVGAQPFSAFQQAIDSGLQ